MVARVTISLPEPLLERLDEIAGADGVTRSDVLREASARYVTLRDADAEARRRAEAVETSLAWLESVASKPQRDPRPSLDILREVRETDDAGRGEPLEPGDA